MSMIDDKVAELNGVLTDISTSVQGVSGDVQTLMDQVEALKAAQGALTTEQAAAVDAVIATAQGIKNSLGDLDARNPAAAPAPVEPAPEAPAADAPAAS